jgi:hypothetical protein
MIAIPKKSSGFSLVEMAILLTIVGLVMVAILDTYRLLNLQTTRNDTKLREEIIATALSGFVNNFGRLPCPADPTLAASKDGAGREMCIYIDPSTVGEPNNAWGQIASPTAYECRHWKNAPPNANTADGVCRRAGARQTYASPTWAGCPIGTKDPILVGVVPYVALGISSKDATDGWGRKFTYVVSEYLTDKTKYNTNIGVISLKKLSGGALSQDQLKVYWDAAKTNPFDHDCNAGTAAVSMPRSTNGAYPFMLVSHGPDGKGAYTSLGNVARACDLTMAGPDFANGRDNENCNKDATFISADPSTGIFNTAAGLAYFDDMSTLGVISTSNDKWLYDGTDKIRNQSSTTGTPARVGIGITNPQYELHVNGKILADNFYVDTYCSSPDTATSKPSYCFTPDKVAGSVGLEAVGCGSSLMTGINGGPTGSVLQAKCENTTTGLPAATCPGPWSLPPVSPPQYVVGIDAAGSVICSP